MTEPTDAELGKLAEECGIGWGAGLGGMSDFLSAFARAVLAKWAAPQQEATKAAPGELKDHQILAITTAYEQGVGKGHQAYKSGKEIATPYDSTYRCDLAWQYGYGEGKEQAQRATKAAPQQEAQEPVAYVHVPHSTVEGKVRPVVSFEKYQQDYDDGIYSTRIPLYTAPQPAPAPLSDDVVHDAAFEAVRKKLCALPRFSFLSDGYGVRRVPDKSGSWIAFDAAHALFDPVAVDAALAAQGEKDAG